MEQSPHCIPLLLWLPRLSLGLISTTSPTSKSWQQLAALCSFPQPHSWLPHPVMPAILPGVLDKDTRTPALCQH